MITLLRVMMFSISMIGYIVASRKWLKISNFSSYIVVFCCIALVVFFSGMISSLELSTYLIFILGLILFLYFGIKEKAFNKIAIESISLIHIAFVLIGSVMCIILLNTNFIHYDNFSHWGTVVKYMLSTNEFPTATTTLIEFSDYPLGASSFIYYVCKIVGNTQGIMLFGQAILIFAAFYAMFDIIKEKKRMLLYVVLALGLCTTSVFNLSIRMNNLLVDFLLPILAVSALSLIYSNRNHLDKLWIQIIPIVGLLLVVKNTGIFFIFTVFCYLGFVVIRNCVRGETRNNIKKLLYCGSTIVLGVLPLLIWNSYHHLKFAGVDTKFNMSQSNMEQVVSSKTPEQIQDILDTFLSTSLDISNQATFMFILINVVGIIAYIIVKNKINTKVYFLRVLLFTDILVVVYYIGLLGMYVFLMPLDEALRIAGFERYVCSIAIYQIGCLMLCITVDIERSFYITMGNVYNPRGFKSIYTKNIYQKSTVLGVLFATMILTSEINGLNYIKNQYESSLPGRVSNVIEENKNTPNNDTYLVYASNENEQVTSYYLQYICRYMLFTPNVDAIDSIGSDLLVTLNEYDYFIIFESDHEIKSMMKQQFGIVVTEGIYKIEDKNIQFINQMNGENTNENYNDYPKS